MAEAPHVSETARNNDRVASPGWRCSISRERQLPHGNDRSSSFVVSQMSFLSDKLQTSSLSRARINNALLPASSFFLLFYCPLSDTWFTHNCNLKKKKETTDLPLFRSSRFDDRTRWHKLEGKFANIIVAITTLSLFYFSIFYFRVDQRGSSFNALPIFHFVSHPRCTPSGRRSFSRYFPFLLFLLDRRIFTIGWISYRLRFVRWIITMWCVFY